MLFINILLKKLMNNMLEFLVIILKELSDINLIQVIKVYEMHLVKEKKLNQKSYIDSVHFLI
jgi:hypothetical protein